MKKHGYFIRPVSIFCIFLLTGACTGVPDKPQPQGPFETVELSLDDSGEKRPYLVLGNRRYISGPYGDEQGVQRLIETIKQHSEPATVSNRAVNLPNKPPNLILEVYDFRTPDACGGHDFRLYEGENLQILEFDFPEDGKTTRIRDYTKGPTPFVSPGLWGPYDHTDGTALEMCLLSGDGSKDGLGLMDSGYEIGWVTNIVDWKQAELGMAYARAVDAGNRCSQQLALARTQESQAKQQRAGHYRVLPGDTLGGIARKLYRDPGRWIDIYTANAERIGPDPNRLPAGITLSIP